MKTIEEHRVDLAVCQRQLDEFSELLNASNTLVERDQIQPYFEQRRDLSALIGSYSMDIGRADRIAFKYPIRGDFQADLVVGNSGSQCYMFVEFEDAHEDSIFAIAGRKATSEWARRFEHGFSQLVDWLYALDDAKGTKRFAEDFGYGHVRFFGVMVVGRSSALSNEEENRLRWRSERILVNSNHIHCITFDDLHRQLTWRIEHYRAAADLE